MATRKTNRGLDPLATARNPQKACTAMVARQVPIRRSWSKWVRKSLESRARLPTDSGSAAARSVPLHQARSSALTAAADTVDAELAHQALDRAAGCLDALAARRDPALPCAPRPDGCPPTLAGSRSSAARHAAAAPTGLGRARRNRWTGAITHRGADSTPQIGSTPNNSRCS